MKAPATVSCQVEPALDVMEFRRVLVESGLGSIRPVDDVNRLSAMLKGANLVVTARTRNRNGALVGVARCVTDFEWFCLLCDLAVCKAAQRSGIGKALLQEVRGHAGPRVSVVLFSVPESTGFYERAGMSSVSRAFRYLRQC